MDHDVTAPVWRKSRRSNHQGACVELAPVAGGIAVRDSKDPHGPVLANRTTEVAALVDAIKGGAFDALLA